MCESKVIKALEEFKAEYSWDKSLVSSADGKNSNTPAALDLSDTHIDDFLRASQARVQQDQA